MFSSVGTPSRGETDIRSLVGAVFPKAKIMVNIIITDKIKAIIFFVITPPFFILTTHLFCFRMLWFRIQTAHQQNHYQQVL